MQAYKLILEQINGLKTGEDSFGAEISFFEKKIKALKDNLINLEKGEDKLLKKIEDLLLQT